MALKIRLARGGSKKRPYYQIVVADARSPRDGRFLEKVGSWNPMLAKDNPQRVELKADLIKEWIAKAATLVWNGPLGAFEIEPFDAATVAAAKFAAEQTKAGKLVSVAGGGDTVAALNHAGVADDFSYVSTAGGAFLEWMEGKELPGVAVLSRSE